MNQAAAVECIQDARKVLSDPKRWHKGDFTNGEGAYCVRGALLPGKPCSQPLVAAAVWAQELLVEHIPGDFVDVLIREGLIKERLAAFNDHPDTTHEDILNLLDKTLADLGGLA